MTKSALPVGSAWVNPKPANRGSCWCAGTAPQGPGLIAQFTIPVGLPPRLTENVARISTPVNKSEFITGYGNHLRNCRSHAFRLFVILVACGFAIAAFNVWLDPRYPAATPIVTLGLIITLVSVICWVSNAVIRNSASAHGLHCPQCCTMLGKARVAGVAIMTGKCECCGYTLFHETKSAEDAALKGEE